MRSARRGFTLVELLVVISIIAVLAGLLLFGLQAAQEAGRRTQCLNRLNQIGKAFIAYATDHGKLPVGIQAQHPSTGKPFDWTIPGAGATALVYILPKIEESKVPYDLSSASLGAENGPAVSTQIESFRCPSDSAEGRALSVTFAGKNSFARSNFVVCFGSAFYMHDFDKGDGYTDGAFRMNRAKRFEDFGDGRSKTAILSEVLAGQDDDMTDNVSDARGLWAFWHMGAFNYTHFNTPNAGQGDVLRKGSKTYCAPMDHAPCGTGTEDYDTHQAAARSRHSRGVNVTFGDGHGIFQTDEIDADVWKNLATIDGDYE